MDWPEDDKHENSNSLTRKYKDYRDDSEWEEPWQRKSEPIDDDEWNAFVAWVAGKGWKAERLPNLQVNAGTDRFGTYHEFVWPEVRLGYLVVRVHFHIHLDSTGAGNHVAGGMWIDGYSGTGIKRGKFPELDRAVAWLKGKFPKVL